MAIRTEDLTKHFGRVAALEGLTLEVPQGQVFGFLGANGAGKTTTIRLLLDLLRPTRGRAFLNGHDCHRDGLRARADVGYLPGEMPLYPDITGGALIEFLATLQPSRPEPHWAELLLTRFGLTPQVLDRRMVHLSHGMKQKVGLVQALMARPRVIVLDEPTAGLDPLVIEAFCETIAELRASGHTIFLSSHVLSEVERLCDTIALVAAGRLVRVASIGDIRREFPRRVRVTFAGTAPLPRAIPGVHLLHASDSEWRLELRGEMGALLAHLRGTPVADVQVDNFRLEDYILALYDRSAP